MRLHDLNYPLCNCQRTATTNLGGGERVRTDDPLRARQVLSQLSYTPNYLVGLDGLEPSTSRLSVVCSSQLSYRPLKSMVSFSRQPTGPLVIANHDSR